MLHCDAHRGSIRSCSSRTACRVCSTDQHAQLPIKARQGKARQGCRLGLAQGVKVLGCATNRLRSVERERRRAPPPFGLGDAYPIPHRL